MWSKNKKNKDKNNLEKEINSLEIYTDGLETKIIKSRIDHLLDWYIRKSTFYKNLFYTLSVFSIFINAFIPIVAQFNVTSKDIIISIMSGIAAVITSILTLFTTKETWFRYRNHAELIKQECVQCISQVGDYKKDYKQDDRERILIEKVELIISNERSLWKKDKFDNNENLKDE